MIPELVTTAEFLCPLRDAAGSVTEGVARATIEGGNAPDVGENLLKLLEYRDEHNLQNVITVQVEDVETDAEELRDQIGKAIPVRTWRVLVHKERIAPIQPGVRLLWFLDEKQFRRWAEAIDPFSADPEWKDSEIAVCILVEGIKSSFGGPRLAVADISAAGIPEDWPRAWQGPNDEEIKKQVHLLTDEATVIDPGRFFLDWGDLNSDNAAAFRALGARTLATCLTQVSYRSKKVVLKGAKILELPLYDETADLPSAEDVGRLKTAVEWVYEERPEVRAELIADRLSLDLNPGESMLSGTFRLLDEALAQAKDRYRFVIAEQKEAWTKELREVLKDVQSQTRLYSDKLRSIMNSLLRDVLAALLLVSLGLFARIGRSHDVLGSHEAQLLFRALGFYLLTSFLLQAFVHLRDLHISDHEVREWAKQTRTHLGPDALKTYLNAPLNRSRHQFFVTGSVLALTYIFLAAVAWFFQPLLRALGLFGP